MAPIFDKKRLRYVVIVGALIILYALFSSGAKIPFVLGNYYFGGGAYNINLAKTFFDIAYKINPGHPRLNYQIARVHFIQGNFPEAKRYINQELEYFPDYKRSYYVRGLINGYSENLKEAALDFEIFLKTYPTSWAGHNDLVWVYFKMGDFKKVEQLSRNGLKSNPDNPWLLNSLGVSLLNQKKYLEAEKVLSQSLEGFEKMDPKVWGYSYPGNDPRIYAEGLSATTKSVEKNLGIVRKKLGITE